MVLPDKNSDPNLLVLLPILMVLLTVGMISSETNNLPVTLKLPAVLPPDGNSIPILELST